MLREGIQPGWAGLMLVSGGDKSPVRKVRARRFDLEIPLRYRVPGDSTWCNGVTKNISCTGVLFQSRDRAAPGTLMEITLRFPNAMLQHGAAELLCRGSVIRSERREEGGDSSIMATTSTYYRLVRP